MEERGFFIEVLDFTASSFQNSFKKLEPQLQREAMEMISLLSLKHTGKLPAKLHFHNLQGHCGVYTIHVTSNDCYKASFTIEGGVARFRRIAKHDNLDNNP